MSATPAKPDELLILAAEFMSRPASGAETPAVPPLRAGTGPDMGGGEIVELARPERRRARVSEACESIAAKFFRRNLWPKEFRACRSRNITLRHTDLRPMRIEVRWRKGRGFAAMAAGFRAVAQGDSQDHALATLIKALEPEVETVRDDRRRRLI